MKYNNMKYKILMKLNIFYFNKYFFYNILYTNYLHFFRAYLFIQF